MIVVREEVGDCCDWCADLAGTYDYEDAPKEVWQRHAHCRCMVITRTKKGLWQDAYSKKYFKSHKEARREKEKDLQNSSYLKERRKKPESDNNFKTFNNTRGDSIRPSNIRKNLSKTAKGREILEFIEKNNVEIQLFYGVDNPDNLLGSYDPIGDEISIYCDLCKTIKKTSSTVIHEVTHMQNKDKGLSPFRDEYEAYVAEELHERGILTKEAEEFIIKFIENEYGFKRD